VSHAATPDSLPPPAPGDSTPGAIRPPPVDPPAAPAAPRVRDSGDPDRGGAGAIHRVQDRGSASRTINRSDPPQDVRPVAIPGLKTRGRAGCGGRGAVNKASQPAPDRLVALKTVQARFLPPRGLDLFQREPRLLARCSHPNVVRILEFHPEHAVP